MNRACSGRERLLVLWRILRGWVTGWFVQCQCTACIPEKQGKGPASLEGLCPAVQSCSFLEAGDPEQPRSPWGAWSAPPGPGEQMLLWGAYTGCTGHHWEKNQPPSVQNLNLKTAGRAWHWWELWRGMCPLPGISSYEQVTNRLQAGYKQVTSRLQAGYKQVTSTLQRCPTDSQQEVQTSSSDLRVCASQGWQQNKICMNQASGPDQLSSKL